MSVNEVIIPEKEIYELLKTKDSQDPNKLNKIIRHFKVIKRNDYDNTVNVTKYIKDENIIAYKYDANDYLSQDIDDYNNSIVVEPFELYNVHKDYPKLVNQCNEDIKDDQHNVEIDIEENNESEENNKTSIIVFNGKHYNSIDEIQNEIDDLTQEAITNYVRDILSISNNTDDYTDIDEIINNFKNSINNDMYIRMAPPKSKKEELIKRILKFNNIGMSLDLALNDGIPVFNDNIIYKNGKYNYIVNKLFENNIIDENTRNELLN